MAKILDALTQHCTEEGWRFDPVPDRPAIRLSFSGKHGRWVTYASERLPSGTPRQALVYSVSSVNVPEDRRGEVAEYLTRANYGMVMGNFEMDYSDGEVRYKTVLDIGDGELDPKALRPLFSENLRTFDRYFPGLMALLYGGVSAEAAVNKVESGGFEESSES